MQILSLTKENNILLQQADKNPSRTSYDDGKGHYKDLFPKVGSGATTSAGEIKETINFSVSSTKVGTPLFSPLINIPDIGLD